MKVQVVVTMDASSRHGSLKQEDIPQAARDVLADVLNAKDCGFSGYIRGNCQIDNFTVSLKK